MVVDVVLVGLLVVAVVVIVVAVDALVKVVLFGFGPFVVAAVLVVVVVVGVVFFAVKISSPPITLELGPSTIIDAGINLPIM